jgi:Protein of unknwon function (DUF3310)
MATKKATKKASTSRAAKMREYYTANPTATVSQVAKKFKTTYQIAYMCKKGMEPKKLVLGRAEVEVANRLGIPTKDYAKQKAKILKEPKTKRTPVKDLNTTLWQPPELLPVPEAITMIEPPNDPVNHPAHYKVGGIETIDFIEAKKLNYNMGNAVKYISRADHKGNKKQDLQKAIWYIDREIARI